MTEHASPDDFDPIRDALIEAKNARVRHEIESGDSEDAKLFLRCGDELERMREWANSEIAKGAIAATVVRAMVLNCGAFVGQQVAVSALDDDAQKSVMTVICADFFAGLMMGMRASEETDREAEPQGNA